jgi:cytochrome bd-type quinol oxidase subunit 2
MRVLTAAFAIASGIIVLLGYFIPLEQLDLLRLRLIDWAIVIAGTAVLIGIANLVFVQMEKIRARGKESAYSALLVLSLVVTFGLGLVLGPDDQLIRLAMDAVIVPVEASLMAILTVTLVYAGIRLFRRRVDAMTVVFLLIAIISLIATMPTPLGPIPGDWLILQFTGMFSGGGARGLLIGIALGTLLTGLRVLFGIDRPYGGN